MTVIINGNNTPVAGSVTYGDGTTYANTAAGTSGQYLQSNGASAPTWVTPAGGGSLLRTTVFTSSDTWTKGANTTQIKVYGVGGGGGGGGASAG